MKDILIIFGQPFYGKMKILQNTTPFNFINWQLHLPSWASETILGVEIWRIVLAIIFIFLGFSLKKISDYLFEKKIIPVFKKTRIEIDNLFFEALSKPLGFMLLLAGLAANFAILPLPEQPDINRFVMSSLKVASTVIILWFLFRLVDVATKSLAHIVSRTESKLDKQMVPFISRAVKIVMGIIIVLWILQLSGYNISSLLAGLGIGGLAVALALQETLANFFGSLAIFTDRPFGVGEIIEVDDIRGTVEEIGFRSTRIRTFNSTLVTIPNKTLANSVIENISKAGKRRVVQAIKVTHKTTTTQLQEAVPFIRNIVLHDKNVDPESVIVNFSDFGEYSLNITIIYFTKVFDYREFLASKERINLAIMKNLEQLGISIAFPTKIYIDNISKKTEGSSATDREQKKAKEGKEGENLPFSK